METAQPSTRQLRRAERRRIAKAARATLARRYLAEFVKQAIAAGVVHGIKRSTGAGTSRRSAGTRSCSSRAGSSRTAAARRRWSRGNARRGSARARRGRTGFRTRGSATCSCRTSSTTCRRARSRARSRWSARTRGSGCGIRRSRSAPRQASTRTSRATRTRRATRAQPVVPRDVRHLVGRRRGRAAPGRGRAAREASSGSIRRRTPSATGRRRRAVTATRARSSAASPACTSTARSSTTRRRRSRVERGGPRAAAEPLHARDREPRQRRAPLDPQGDAAAPARRGLLRVPALDRALVAGEPEGLDVVLRAGRVGVPARGRAARDGLGMARSAHEAGRDDARALSPGVLADKRTKLPGYEGQYNCNPDRQVAGIFERRHSRFFVFEGENVAVCAGGRGTARTARSSHRS
jgi:hypothetical protein